MPVMHRTFYWIHVGRALSKLPGRRDYAVRALRTARNIPFPDSGKSAGQVHCICPDGTRLGVRIAERPAAERPVALVGSRRKGCPLWTLNKRA